MPDTLEALYKRINLNGELTKLLANGDTLQVTTKITVPTDPLPAPYGEALDKIQESFSALYGKKMYEALTETSNAWEQLLQPRSPNVASEPSPGFESIDRVLEPMATVHAHCPHCSRSWRRRTPAGGVGKAQELLGATLQRHINKKHMQATPEDARLQAFLSKLEKA